MVRNEIDIIAPWLKHNLALFDHLYVADHMSEDGTYEALEAASAVYPQLKVLRYKERTYDQDTVLEILRTQALYHDFEWLFVLDADEFIGAECATNFRSSLNNIEAYDVLTYRWRNCYADADQFVSCSFSGKRENSLSTFGKIAIRRNIAEDRNYFIPKGGHRLNHQSMGPIQGFELSELNHFPIRSLDQLRTKIIQGCESFLSIPGYNGIQGRHWFELRKYIDDDRLGWPLVPNFVHNYGNPIKSDILEMEANEYFHPWVFDMAHVSFPSEIYKHTDSTLGARRSAIRSSTLVDLRTSKPIEWGNSMNADVLTIKSNEIRHLADFEGRRFEALAKDPVEDLGFESLIDALQSAFFDIKDPVNSAWGEHIPFLFSLVTLLKPRRYVELGVHRGASYFAACQAIQHNRTACECVAVDNWIGDPHAGMHALSTFNNFRETLTKRYREFAGYIKSDFDIARTQFDDGSVDLLHIDGFHSTDAVRSDFETWIRTLSDRAVVMFHDTNEFKADFGVWRFWRLMRQQYPSIEFGHGHGLGILMVGENSVLRRTLSGTDFSLASAEGNELLQVMFGGLGRISWNLAGVTAKPAADPKPPADLKPATEPKPAADPNIVSDLLGQISERDHRIKALNDERAYLEKRLRKFDKSVYGRVRGAVRRVRSKLKKKAQSAIGSNSQG